MDQTLEFVIFIWLSKKLGIWKFREDQSEYTCTEHLRWNVTQSPDCVKAAKQRSVHR